MTTTHTSYLLESIIDITQDEGSKQFWLKAINILGETIVETELGELKYQMRIGVIEHPAKYLTTLLKKRMDGNLIKEERTHPDKLQAYFHTTQAELFNHLQPIKPKGEHLHEQMAIPYGKKKIPWTTFLSASFFTLSTNKAKSDTVTTRLRTLDGNVFEIAMIRGRIGSGCKERGILNAQHAKILAALKTKWAEQGCLYSSYPNNAKVCYCFVSVRDLAKLLGWKSFGGRDLRWLKDMTYDMKAIPYYLDFSHLNMKGIHGYGFSLLNSVTLVEGKKHGQEESVLHIEFSVPLSVQLIYRHAVTRSKGLLTVRNELAALLLLYLEPILISRNGQEYSKQLKDIILDLQLPKSDWHKKASRRKILFEKAIKELHGYKVDEARKIGICIEKGLYDYMLVARLVE